MAALFKFSYLRGILRFAYNSASVRPARGV